MMARRNDGHITDGHKPWHEDGLPRHIWMLSIFWLSLFFVVLICGLHCCGYYSLSLFVAVIAVSVTVLFVTVIVYTVSQKKPSHFNFQHNFATCWDICTIFDAPCSGIIHASHIVLHAHHRCKAFTWSDVTRMTSVKLLHLVHTDTRFHATWLIAS